MPGTLVFRNHHRREHRLYERAVRVVERKHRRLWSAEKMKGPIPDLSPNTPDMEHTTPEGSWIVYHGPFPITRRKIYVLVH